MASLMYKYILHAWIFRAVNEEYISLMANTGRITHAEAEVIIATPRVNKEG